MHVLQHSFSVRPARCPARTCRRQGAQRATRRHPRLVARAAEDAVPAAQEAPPPQGAPDRQQDAPRAAAPPEPNGGTSNALLAGGAVALGVLGFLAARLSVGGPSFAALEDASVPLEVALTNGRPTVVEFYASWCEVCRELLPVTYEAEQKYAGRVNFVLLNVENTKWSPEVAEYGVGGIPHFVFLDGEGVPQAAAVGRLPQQVLEADMRALANGSALPYARVAEESSPLQQAMAGPKRLAPRDHGA